MESISTANWLERPAAAALKPSPALYDRPVASMSWPLAQRTQPFSDSTTVTGSVGISSFSDRALASARSTIGERRSSP
ncbi:hypothetical protein D3C81_1382150 [compost metagenome]